MAEGAAPPRDTSVEILTLGCRLNSYESEVMRAHAAEGGASNTVVVNTCAVTAEAVRQARQAIRRVRRDRPAADIVVTGCAAQIDPLSFADMPEVTRVIGNAEKLAPDALTPPPAAPRIQVGDIMAERGIQTRPVDGLEGRARAFVQVQTGCDHRCTFCVIPFGRGNARSAPPDEVLSQVRRLVDRGHHEIVLTGVDLTSWGGDLPGAPRLGDLVQTILAQTPDLPQLRLSSVDAIELDPLLFELATTEPRIAPYLHLSLQSGDDMILKRMKRRHARADAISLCGRLRERRPDIALGADFIAGFPTESEEMFEQTLQLIDTCGVDFVHAFPFSPRPGTPAARMPQIPGEIIRLRAARLREKAEERLWLRLGRHVGSQAMALVEGSGRARLPDFSPVRIEGGVLPAGRSARLALVGRTRSELLGQPA